MQFNLARCSPRWPAGLPADTKPVARSYPDHPVHLVVPFPPGGPADIVARTLSEKLSVALGQPVIVINKSGASGTAGAAFVAKSDPDGYTLLMGTSNELTMSPGLYSRLPYDPSRDFEPISTVILFPNVLVASQRPADSGPRRVWSRLTRSNPGKVSFGTSGTGSTNHLTTELYRASTKVDLNYVPYRGGAPALADLMGGQIQAMFATMPSSSGFIKSGSIRGLMVTDNRRWAAIPDVPSATEGGIARCPCHQLQWRAGAGRHLAHDHVRRLHDEIVSIMRCAAAIKAAMLEQAGEVSTSSPQEFAKILKADFDMWLSVIKAYGIHID